jgi:hypothetical protein
MEVGRAFSPSSL